jgi:hypothetical protein
MIKATTEYVHGSEEALAQPWWTSAAKQQERRVNDP